MDGLVSSACNLLRKQWDKTASRAPFRPYPEVTDGGLIFGVGTILAKADEAQSRSFSNPADHARLYVLLAVAGGRPAPSQSVHFIGRALRQWSKGEHASRRVRRRGRSFAPTF